MGWGWLLACSVGGVGMVIVVIACSVGGVGMVIACSVGGVGMVIMVIGQCIFYDFFRLTMNSWL